MDTKCGANFDPREHNLDTFYRIQLGYNKLKISKPLGLKISEKKIFLLKILKFWSLVDISTRVLLGFKFFEQL